MLVSKTTQTKLVRRIIRLFTYGGIFLLLNVSLAVFFYMLYGMQNPIDWILTGIYALLSIASYYIFSINDIHAVKLKGRSMALGFLSGHIGLSLLVMSFIFALPEKMALYVAGILMVVSYMLGTYGINKWSRHHQQNKRLLKHELKTDQLTQLFNRRALAQNALHEEQFSRESKSDLSLLILDIDDFKIINDQHGHTAGDEVLKQVSQVFNHYLRKSGSVYRWGGEEFVMLLPVTGLFEANRVANKLIEKIAEKDFVINDVLTLKLTISIGVAQWLADESLCKETLERADQALYKAKSAGKNAVVVADYKDNSYVYSKEDQTKTA
ncbi:MAG: GGDEF domain-containing protein [Marinicella sp.]